MLYFLWGGRRNLKLVTLGSKRVKRGSSHATCLTSLPEFLPTVVLGARESYAWLRSALGQTQVGTKPVSSDQIGPHATSSGASQMFWARRTKLSQMKKKKTFMDGSVQDPGDVPTHPSHRADHNHSPDPIQNPRESRRVPRNLDWSSWTRGGHKEALNKNGSTLPCSAMEQPERDNEELVQGEIHLKTLAKAVTRRHVDLAKDGKTDANATQKKSGTKSKKNSVAEFPPVVSRVGSVSTVRRTLYGVILSSSSSSSSS